MSDKIPKQTSNRQRLNVSQTVRNLERHLARKPDPLTKAQTPVNLENALAKPAQAACMADRRFPPPWTA
jgi:hypothetical protein